MQITITTAIIALTSTLGTLALLQPMPVHAALITSDFTVNNLSGSLTGGTYTGSLSYNDSSLTGIDEEFIPVQSVLFNFQGNQYTEVDDPNASVDFFNGAFIGLSYTIGNLGESITFSFVPDFFDYNLSEAYFTYELTESSGAINFGEGNITYATIPTPALLPGLLGLGLGVWRKKSKQDAYAKNS